MLETFQFAFDPSDFKKGLDTLSKGITTMTSGFEIAGKKMDTIYSGMKSQVNQLIVRVGALAGAYLGARALLARMPEVGQAFSIAGDILMKNLVWPLRQELLPYLQKMLNWARDNRTTMLQYGSVLVNVFRAAKTIVGQLLDLFKPIYESFKKIMGRIFGESVKSMSDILNILLFKVTVMVLFITEALKPIFRSIGKIMLMLYDLAEAFGKGLLDGFESTFGSWGKVIGDLITAFQELFDAIAGINDSEAKEGLKTLSFLFGTLLGGAIKGVLIVITDLVRGLTALFKMDIKEIPLVKRWTKLFDAMGFDTGKAIKNIKESIKSLFSFDMSLVPGWFKSMIDFFNLLGDRIGMAMKEIRDKFFNAILDMIKEVEEFVNKYLSWVPGASNMKSMRIIMDKAREEKELKEGKTAPTGSPTNTNELIQKGLFGASNNNVKNNVTVTFGDIKLTANSEEEGRRAAKGFLDQVNSGLYPMLRKELNDNSLRTG